MRITRERLERMLVVVADTAGHESGHYRKTESGWEIIPGGWALDYAPAYGGYCIEEIYRHGDGCMGTWIITDRMSAREMWHWLQGALVVGRMVSK